MGPEYSLASARLEQDAVSIGGPRFVLVDHLSAA